MKLSNNTILVTGGGTGFGRGLAKALHALGNRVIVAERSRALLDEVVTANPGMEAVELDVGDPVSIANAAEALVSRFPTLNILINNASVMPFDNAVGAIDAEQAHATVMTNLLGPILLTSALIDHLKSQPGATIIHSASASAYTPVAKTAVYSASKAALHNYALTQRWLLRDSTVRVLEIAPPWLNQETAAFNAGIAATIEALSIELRTEIAETEHALPGHSDRNEYVAGQRLSDFIFANPLPA